MKKHLSWLAGLAALGAATAGVLTWLHYYAVYGPAAAAICGGTFAGQCADVVSQAEYATLLGVPMAVYGLFFYCFVLFTSLIADYAGEHYHRVAFVLLFPLICLALAADLFLGAVMVWQQAYCLLCIFTYLVNLAMFAVCLLWRRYLSHSGFVFREDLRQLAREPAVPGERAAGGLFLLFVLLLAFAVFSTAHILTLKTAPLRQAKAQVSRAVETFYRQAPEQPVLPESRLRLGRPEAPVQIVAFTDFLCSYCNKFYQVEKEVYGKYGDKVSFVYYSYPLDQECNSQVSGTVYPSACVAARAFLAAAELGVFPQYITQHFARYEEFHAGYDIGKAIDVAGGLAGFRQALEAAATVQVVKRDVALAEKLRINATPTLFINGRRYEGAPTRDVLEAIIERELKGGQVTGAQP